MPLKTLLLATTVGLGGALFSAGLSISAQAQTAPSAYIITQVNSMMGPAVKIPRRSWGSSGGDWGKS